MRLRVLLASLSMLAGVLALPGGALAFNQQIKVYAVVPQMRVIYVNGAGYITKVVGNTSQNVVPKVYDQNNSLITMTDAIQQQYQRFLAEHHGKLEASKEYTVNPVSVDTNLNDQSVQVESNQKILTLSL